VAGDSFLLLGPEVDALDAGIAFDHSGGVVIGVVGDRLDGDEIAGIDFKLRLQQFAEIAPMHGVGICRQAVIGRLAGLGLRRRRSGEGAGAGEGRRCSAAGQEGALEKAASLGIEIVQKLLPMKLKLWVGVVVSCAHDYVPPW
jgi:hypothetical protein